MSLNLQDAGFEPVEASTGEKAVKLFRDARPAAVLLDLKMPGMGGMRTLQELKKIDDAVPVIILSAHGSIRHAVDATKLGAYDFVTKPIDFKELMTILRSTTERLEPDAGSLTPDAGYKTSLKYTIAQSTAMEDAIRQVHQVAGSDFSLIIQGETGTGKSFIARFIHNLSKRSQGPFISVDIGAIPETLIESELFGYEKGAFTGAERRKKGFFEIADGGTLLIDELQNMSPYVQSKLLSAVEERRIYPLGSASPVSVDLRLIGATNADIGKLVQDQKFREDLFYRLGEYIISLPPLRERKEDVLALAKKFFKEAVEDLDKQVAGISEGAEKLLEQHSWPGNVRELKNVIRRAVLLTNDTHITPDHIRFLIQESGQAAPANQEGSAGAGSLPSLNLVDLEIFAIREALASTDGNKAKAASLLRIDYSTLLRKIKQYRISQR